MDNSRISNVIISLSSLYELLLNIGKSFDIQENAEEFLKTLMAQKNLSFAAYFNFEYPNKITKVHAIPKIKMEEYQINADLAKAIVKNKFYILQADHPSFKHIAKIMNSPSNEFMVYFTGIKSIIILAKNNDAFDKRELVKYELVFNHFGLFMESLESHHQIQNEIKIKEEQAEIIKQTNEKLKKQNDNLLNYIRSNNELKQFAYRVSHDLNAPLRSIIQFSQILESDLGDKLTVDQKEYMDFIMKGGTQMKELITGILDYSQITGAKLKLQKINVYQLIENIRNLLYHNLKEANGTIIVKKIPPFIIADHTKMTQLFLNLISNALKFKKEHVNAEIVISGEERENEFVFSVSDNGIGIPLESQAKIFDLFSKASNSSKAEGHGIGLNTCRQIVEQHNGGIWLESTLEEGTTFHFTIGMMSLSD